MGLYRKPGSSDLLRADDGGLAGSEDCCCLDCDGGSNPTFTSSPSTTGTECVLYTYNPTVTTDPVGQTLVWSFGTNGGSPPAGATINAGTGAIAWTPGGTISGSPSTSRHFHIIAEDECGRQASQEWTVTVTDDACCDNDPPTITSSGGTSATEGVEYTYQVTVDDDAPENVTYCLTVWPDGMSIDGSGLITWTPGCDQAGQHNVTVCVGDDCYDCETEEGDCESYVITVADDPECV